MDNIEELDYQSLDQRFGNLLENAPNINKEMLEKTSFEISGYPHYENVASNWYGYFLDTSESHGLKDLFVKSLTEIVRAKGGPDMFLTACSVMREYQTDKGNFIDILAYESSQEGGYRNPIIIENKINADLYNDLEDYYDSIKELEAEDNQKAAIVLSLKPVSMEGRHQKYINITHGEWLAVVKKNLGEYILGSNPKYLNYLQDFIQNIERLTDMGRVKMLKDHIIYCMENAEEINELITIWGNAINHIGDQLQDTFSDTSWEWARKNSGSISFKMPNTPFVGYVHHGEIFNKKEYRIEIWISGAEYVKKWLEIVKSELTEKYEKMINMKASTDAKEWASLGDKKYAIDKKNIENFSSSPINFTTL